MKKLMMLLALGATVALMPSVSKATIVGSAHDFYTGSTTNLLWANGVTGLIGKTANVCGECHDIHKAPNPANGPLWVHAPSATLSYLTYDQAGSETFNALGLTVSLGTSSKACLSCHDGTVGINQQLKLGMDDTTTATTSFLGSTNSTAVIMPAGFYPVVNHNDLTHTHPIGISYVAARTALNTENPSFAELNDPTATYFKDGGPLIQSQLKGLGKTQMECSTCHDIHNTRTMPRGQDLCTSCHNK